ncbi:hypothetical protein [Chitinophaga nivalis]|uniref:Uncharacterized protein n=1 Tax=Chitinophaga nivalis TaxID=2991709 RepID=A0ABT3INE8_9BACT|nr:hypothetical protein [Chitinophaga nivalis]MCW3464797.1 hypothetical protein [Chitinophaga nivalis]MCW3485512.1 hypothetical protein [Chitinophaga nivalis]
MKKITAVIYMLLLVGCVSMSCRKVENDIDDQFEQPSVSTTTFTMANGKSFEYPKAAKPGDTITIGGRLNLHKGAVIRLGKENAAIISVDTLAYKYFFTGQWYTFEVARFVVTAGMGSGPQPLVVTCGRFSNKAPDILLMVPGEGGNQPDTTMMVTAVFNHGIPDFAVRYKPYKENEYFTRGRQVTSNGTVYISSAWDVYRFANGQVENVLKKEDGIIIDGQQLEIKEILGMAPDPANTQLYLSVRAIVPATDDYRWANFLLRKDLASGQITVLNKTELEVYPDFDDMTGNTRPATPGWRGKASQLPLFATQLKVDAKGRLLFADDRLKFYGRIDAAGNVTPLIESYYGQGGLFKYLMLFGFTQDGLAAFVAHENKPDYPWSSGVMVYDLDREEPDTYVDAGVNFTYASFDPDPARRMKEKNGFFGIPEMEIPTGTYLPVSRKEMLFVNSFSMAAVNHTQAYLYVYAGIELGCTNTQNPDLLLPKQKELTGPALYVNYGFSEEQGNLVFIGTDASGKVYFMRGGKKITYPARKYVPPYIYTLGK